MLLAQTPSPLGFLSNPLLMMIVVMGIFYVLLILPQQRRQKQHRAMLAALKTGDKVITNGGIYGTVAGIDEDTVIVRIADQVKIKMLRSAIAQVETGEGTK
jgi:preprotein translocase subunit YajC